MPVQNLAKLCHGITEMFEKFEYHDGSAFGHALEGNLHLVFTQVRPTSRCPAYQRVCVCACVRVYVTYINTYMYMYMYMYMSIYIYGRALRRPRRWRGTRA